MLLTKENRNIVLIMSAVALLFGFTVTKDVSIPKVLLYGAMGIGGIILFVKSISKPEWLTYVLVVYLPFSRVLVGDFGGVAQAVNVTNILMILIVFVWIGGRYAENESKWVSSTINIPLILFMLLGLVSVIRGTSYYSGNFFPAFTEYKRWFTPFFLYFLVLNTVKRRDMVHNIFILMMVTTTIVGLMASYDYLNVTGSSIEKRRIGGICDQPNQLAGFFVFYMFLPFALFLQNSRKPAAWFLNLAFMAQFRGIMVTFSRGGYLGFAAGLAAIVYFRSKILFLFLIFGCILLYFNPSFLPGGIRYRMGQTIEQRSPYDETIDTEDLESSSKTRIEIWKGAIQMIKDYPLFGVGYSLFEDRIEEYWEGGKKDAHNQYLIIGAEMGLPALGVFLIILFMMWRNANLLYKSTADPFAKAMALGIIGGLFGLLMNNMFGSRLNAQEVSSYLWIMAALVVRLLVLDKNEIGVISAGVESAVPRRQTLDACWFEEEKK